MADLLRVDNEPHAMDERTADLVMHSKAADVGDRREFPRIPFKASSLVIEPTSGEIVVAYTTELSRFGCFVETIKPLPRRSRVHVEIAGDEDTFRASGVVAYVTGAGMGIAFGMVESKSYEILAKWLSRAPRRSARFGFYATAEVRDLASRSEQVAITRDVSTGGCFIKTDAPLPGGTRIRVRIEHDGAEFMAIGRVTDNVSTIGMGVEFLEMEPKYRAILDNWLSGKG